MPRLRNKQQRDEILHSISELYPSKRIELDYETAFQLLIAVMLSAQMTDTGVNRVTPALFALVREPADMLTLKLTDLTRMIRSVNYFNTKAKHIYRTAHILQEKYHGKIPETLEEMMELPGVGIKTAKVVLSHVYDHPYIGVDTHIHRVMNRMGIVKTKTPEQTDQQLEKILTNEQKRTMHHAIVLFGRYVCTARKCRCSETSLCKWCMCEQCRLTKH